MNYSFKASPATQYEAASKEILPGLSYLVTEAERAQMPTVANIIKIAVNDTEAFIKDQLKQMEEFASNSNKPLEEIPVASAQVVFQFLQKLSSLKNDKLLNELKDLTEAIVEAEKSKRE